MGKTDDADGAPGTSSGRRPEVDRRAAQLIEMAREEQARQEQMMQSSAGRATDHRDRMIEVGSKVRLLSIARVDEAFRGMAGTVVDIQAENRVTVCIERLEKIKQSKLIKVVPVSGGGGAPGSGLRP